MAALERWQPTVVLCSFMGVGQDWAQRWRDLRVAEYVLVGTLGSGDGCYVALNDTKTPGYRRVLLEEVSAQLLDAHAAPRCGEESASRAAQLCAVAFRRID